MTGCLPSLRPILNLILTALSRLRPSRSAPSPPNTRHHHNRYIPRAKLSSRTDYLETEVLARDDRHPFARLPEDKDMPQGRGRDLELETLNANEGGIQV